jgi:hypothetical protein
MELWWITHTKDGHWKAAYFTSSPYIYDADGVTEWLPQSRAPTNQYIKEELLRSPPPPPPPPLSPLLVANPTVSILRTINNELAEALGTNPSQECLRLFYYTIVVLAFRLAGE